MNELTLNILKILFLALLHTHLWLSWAKKDYLKSLEKIKFSKFRRWGLLILPIVLTFLSIVVVDYPVPDNWFFRSLVDIIAIGVIIWFRFCFVNKKKKK